MKNILKYIACCMTAVAMAACGDLYETHEKYLDMAEDTYIGMADSLQANGGLRRVELKWQLNADPRISNCVITWNGCEKALIIPADRSANYMSTIIDLPEGKYIFKIVIKSDSGKESLPQTISGEAYGDNYRATLPQKGISKFSYKPQGAVIDWVPEENCTAVELTYISNDGIKKTITVDGNETSSWIKDFNHRYSELEQTSIFKPEKDAVDDIKSFPVKHTYEPFPGYYILTKAEWEDTFHQQYVDLDHKGWDFKASTQELTGETPVPNGTVEALKDGLLETYWHSQWKGDGANPPLPHTITMDMLQQHDITSIELARRKDNADLKTVVYSISNDNSAWTEFGTVTFANDKAQNALILVLDEPVNGRYIRATITESYNKVNASISEIFFTSGNMP